MSEKLLTLEEVALYLDMSKNELKSLVEKGDLPAYKIGGSFLRFKREHVEDYRRIHDFDIRLKTERPAWAKRGYVPREAAAARYTFWERIKDFLYYNDFYIVSLIALVLIVLAVFEF